MTSACLSIITERTIGGQTLPANVRIVAAGNDEGNVIALDSASRTRFRFLKAHPDADTILVKIDNLNPFVKEVITEHPQLIERYGSLETIVQTNPGAGQSDPDDTETFELDFDMDEDGFSQMCVPRTIEYLSKYLNTAHLDQSKSPISRASFIQHMDMYDEKSLLQIIVEGSIGTNDFTNKLMDKLNIFYRDLLQSTTVSQQTMTNLPTFDRTAFSHITQTQQVDQEPTVIANMTPDTRVNLLVSLLLQNNVNSVNDNALVGRTLNNLLAHNDPIPFEIQSALYQIATTNPGLLSKTSINQMTTTGSLSNIAQSLKDAVNF